MQVINIGSRILTPPIDIVAIFYSHRDDASLVGGRQIQKVVIVNEVERSEQSVVLHYDTFYSIDHPWRVQSPYHRGGRRRGGRRYSIGRWNGKEHKIPKPHEFDVTNNEMMMGDRPNWWWVFDHGDVQSSTAWVSPRNCRFVKQPCHNMPSVMSKRPLLCHCYLIVQRDEYLATYIILAVRRISHLRCLTLKILSYFALECLISFVKSTKI